MKHIFFYFFIIFFGLLNLLRLKFSIILLLLLFLHNTSRIFFLLNRRIARLPRGDTPPTLATICSQNCTSMLLIFLNSCLLKSYRVGRVRRHYQALLALILLILHLRLLLVIFLLFLFFAHGRAFFVARRLERLDFGV